MDHATSVLEAQCERFVALCKQLVRKNLAHEREQNAPVEFRSFCRDPRVTAISVTNNLFFFGTTKLAMQSPIGFYWVGEFVVRIDAATKEIVCKGNIPQPGADGRAKYHHPHLSQYDTPCLGGTGQMKVTDFFGDGKLAHVAAYMLEFLCLARNGSHYVPATAWPMLTDDEVIQWKKLLPYEAKSFFLPPNFIPSPY